MSKDKRNVFNDPPEMIARKLRIFRESPYFTEYVERQQQKQSWAAKVLFNRSNLA